MASETDEFKALSRLCWEAVAARPCMVSGRRVDVPPLCPIQQSISDGRYSDQYPVLRHLDQALHLASEAGFSDITGIFSKLPRQQIRWSQNANYTKENCDQSLLDGYAYSPLTGPDGPIHAASPRGGLALVGPNVFYPAHHHETREVYLVLSAGFQWRLDDGDWFDVPPGNVIFHDRWVRHSMRTGDKPALAFAGWIEPGDRMSVRFTEGT